MFSLADPRRLFWSFVINSTLPQSHPESVSSLPFQHLLPPSSVHKCSQSWVWYFFIQSHLVCQNSCSIASSILVSSLNIAGVHGENNYSKSNWELLLIILFSTSSGSTVQCRFFFAFTFVWTNLKQKILNVKNKETLKLREFQHI